MRRAVKASPRNSHPIRTASYADDALLIQGAIAGQGLAIVRDVYAAQALEAGSIMLAIDAPMPTPASYFAVIRPDKVKAPKIAAFRAWLRREAANLKQP